MCDVKCTQCSGPTNCSTCATNLVPVGNQCICDTVSDPSLSYNTANNMCYSCNIFLSNCLACQPDPLNCTSC